MVLIAPLGKTDELEFFLLFKQNPGKNFTFMSLNLNEEYLFESGPFQMDHL